MDDLISRKAAIKAIYALHEDGEDGISSYLNITDVGSYPYLKDDYTEGLADCVSEIEDLSSVQQWIPCNERLPEKSGEYLTCSENRCVHILSWYDGWNCSRDVDGTVYRRTEIKDIIAWQPLPEPYVEVKKNG